MFSVESESVRCRQCHILIPFETQDIFTGKIQFSGQQKVSLYRLWTLYTRSRIKQCQNLRIGVIFWILWAAPSWHLRACAQIRSKVRSTRNAFPEIFLWPSPWTLARLTGQEWKFSGGGQRKIPFLSYVHIVSIGRIHCKTSPRFQKFHFCLQA